jgi:hypothetical protein
VVILSNPELMAILAVILPKRLLSRHDKRQCGPQIKLGHRYMHAKITAVVMELAVHWNAVPLAANHRVLACRAWACTFCF